MGSNFWAWDGFGRPSKPKSIWEKDDEFIITYIGNIYCSLSFENNLNIKQHFLYSIITVISIKMTLQYFNTMDIKFKWPNDIFYQNKKFGGVILETVTLEDYKSAIIKNPRLLDIFE